MLNGIINYCLGVLLYPWNRLRSSFLNYRGIVLFELFQQFGKLEQLEESITYFRRSLVLLPPGNHRSSSLASEIGNAILNRFRQTGSMEDLEEAITFHRQSLVLHRPSSLAYLGEAILTRFRQVGRVEDLEEAITCFRQALHLCPPGHLNHYTLLGSLAVSIHDRFGQAGRIEDLNESIIYHRQSLAHCPPDDPNLVSLLDNFAVVILERFQLAGRVEDLDEAIVYHRQSLDLRPPGHPKRSLSLAYLSHAIVNRYRHTGGAEDLEEAIPFLREALDLCPPGNPNHFALLCNLAVSLHDRFLQTRGVDDLYDATKYLLDAEAVLPVNHPTLTFLRTHRASLYLEQYDIDPTSQYLSIAFALFEESVNHSAASVKTRFIAALTWASAARNRTHESAIRAYFTALTLLNRYLIANPTLESQQKFLASTPHIPKSLASDAASSAIEMGKPEAAVELLEQGRALVWSEMRDYRHPLQDLRKVNPDLANQFERLSSKLEQDAISSESNSMNPKIGNVEAAHESSVSFEVKQREYRVLAKEWEKVVESIREVEGFANFLKAVPFATLRKAAVEGPVIIINISHYRSDAIIVRNTGRPVIVPLPDAPPEDLTSLSSQLANPRAASSVNFSSDLLQILRTLWNIIVSPIKDCLDELGVAKRTRIWWCPTSSLCALPLHAAGLFRSNARCISDLYIPSYTSTLSALITARTKFAPKTTLPKMLIIGQHDESLPAVNEELRRIQQFYIRPDVLVGKEANRDAVLSGLRNHSWAHFACHGYRDVQQPFHSSFQLHFGERLMLLDLMKARLPDAELAFLSACHGAAGDILGTPDEVIHLAGALQFCGFRSVVGTLWAMADMDGPDISEDFYKYMFRKPVPDLRDSAEALNAATREMRRREGMTLGRWVAFVHIGV